MIETFITHVKNHIYVSVMIEEVLTVLVMEGAMQTVSDNWFFILLLWILLFTIPFLFSDYIQLWRLSYTISNFISFLDRIVTSSFVSIVNLIEQLLKSERMSERRVRIESSIKNLMELAVIEPTTLETQGLVKKLKLLVNFYNDKLERDVSLLVPNVERTIIQNLVNAVEGLRVLNYIYKIVNHYYRLGMKYRNPYPLVQIYVLMPFIKEVVNALSGAVSTFLKGQPIGDSAGPLTAFKFLKQCKRVNEIKHTIKDTYICLCEFEDRKVYVVKALGPGGTVGHLDDALLYLIERSGVKPKVIITVDAALKLEGEKTGTITEGIGVAIGGLGIEKFNIETIATKYGIPLYAILIKMSIQEALTTMPKEVSIAVDQAIEKLKDIIRSITKPGDEVIFIGVGNTVGVSQ